MQSLQSLCLDLIIEHFERFHLAFTQSKDASLQRNLHFLQRRFSYCLARALLGDGKRTDTYFDFLINKHLTLVDFSWFINSQYLKSIDDIFRHLPNLRKILIKFKLHWSYVDSDEILKSLAKYCSNIVEIDVSHSCVTDRGIEYLCETTNEKLPCPELKNLFANESLITLRGAELLIQSVPSIENFDHPTLPLALRFIHKKNLCKRQEVYFNLTKLNLSTIKFSINVLKSCLTVCPKLESITNFVISNVEDLDALTNSQLKKLISVELKTCLNINIDDFVKAKGRNLKHLSITKFSVSASALSVYCPALETLHMRSVDFTKDDGLELIFPSLTTCSFSHLSNDAVIVEDLSLLSSSSPKLESLSFTCGTLSRELERQIIISCTKSRIININFCYMIDLEISFLRHLLQICHSLKQMSLEMCICDVQYPGEILYPLIETLPNKPQIKIKRSFMME